MLGLANGVRNFSQLIIGQIESLQIWQCVQSVWHPREIILCKVELHQACQRLQATWHVAQCPLSGSHVQNS